jgi:hypothetical protein
MSNRAPPLVVLVGHDEAADAMDACIWPEKVQLKPSAAKEASFLDRDYVD